MALPTGRYSALLLWGKRAHANSVHWKLDFVLTDSGERGSAFVFNGDIGKIMGNGGLRLDAGVWLPANPDDPRSIVLLDLKYDKRHGDTRVTGATRTGGKIACDIKFYQHHFTPQEF